MNPKQTVPLAVTLAPLIAAAPVVLIVGGIVALAAWLLTDDEEKKPEAAPTVLDAETSRKPAETPIFRPIPAKPAEIIPIPSTPRPAIPPVAAQPVQLIHAIMLPVAPVIKVAPPAAPQPITKKFVTRTDLATVFNNGARTLTRTAAVAALKRLGFGKTAAYAALSPDGRFSDWLYCAPDGMISWKS